MKKLFLSAALVFAFAANAQTEVNKTVTETTTAQENALTAQEKEYTKVTQAEIAPAVLKEAVAKYKDYSLVEAQKAEDGTEFKLLLTKDGRDVAVFYKSTGEFIKEVEV